MKKQNIIKVYGLHWKPEIIYEPIKGIPVVSRFKGKVKKKNKEYRIDFWKTRGIYALFKNYEVVYVGKTADMNLGDRIRSHRRNMSDHWDTFSFYSYSGIDYKNEKVITNNRALTATKENIIKTLEAIMINVAEPFLNKQEASFPGASRAIQINLLQTFSSNDIYKRLIRIEKILRRRR